MLTQIPVVSFLPGETGAVNTALLSCADSDRLPVLDVADGVGLGVFERDKRNDHVDLCLFRQIFIFGDNI